MSKHRTKRNSLSSNDVTLCQHLSVDLAKQVFQVAGDDGSGRVIYEDRIKSREAFHAFLTRLPPTVTVLMESGPGAQAWGRLLQAQGTPVRILPAQRVAEHRSGAKNDRNDAHAILRAGRDTSIAAVPIKSTAALAIQALHRARRGYVRRHTALGNQIRGLLLEQGVALAQGDLAVSHGVPRILEDTTQPLPDLLRELLDELLAEWRYLSERIAILTGRLETAAQADKVACRLMTIRGVGPIITTAMLAKQPEPSRFPNARQFAAYFGLVPDQHSSGKKVRLGKMSKRGDGYLRSMMIQGAHAVLSHLKPDSDQPDDRRLLRWLTRLGRKEAAIRLANRNLRIIWVLLQGEQVYQRQPNDRQEPAMSH
ncbi:IS110 family transposase [Pseudomonas entomophila]|uniref:IS110 family transposase n=1 Tax=Pseudomonas entomophila TaxID=312306 RepID=UPI00200F5652|nr:IS110 family transposase [Pseudomonas entomophila]